MKPGFAPEGRSSLLIGQTFGPYRITAALGAGGMGEVYRAIDTKLGRDVAIKVLPTELARDAERLARFEREAKLLASLNHPNIAHVYGFESATLPDGSVVHFLAMELVPGEDLSERLRRGAIPAEEALAIARQMAEGLEEAHDGGIVHRDLKPANVKLTPDGKVKVLDFGLAKASAVEAAAGSGADLSQSPTLARTGTQAGLILGTAAYMSPEQARGKPVDKRSDIWAFGVVLYEMLSGQRLFAGETVSDVLAGVLKTEIDLGKLEPSTPPSVRRLLRSCLERNPKNRLHDIADARLALDEALTGKDDVVSAVAVPVPRRPLVWLVGAGALGVGLALGWLLTRGLPPGDAGRNEAPLHVEFKITAPAGTSLVSGLALSPDGQKLAFVAQGEEEGSALWIRTLAGTEAKMLPGTTGARYPFWSPDGRRIGFFAQNRIKVTDLLGGETRAVAETGVTQDMRGGAWGATDVIVFTPSAVGSLYKVPVRGGKAEAATRIAEGSATGTHRWPSFLPDGKRFLFYGSTGTGVEPGMLYLGKLGSLDAKPLGPATSSGVWAAPGYLLYARGTRWLPTRSTIGGVSWSAIRSPSGSCYPARWPWPGCAPSPPPRMACSSTGPTHGARPGWWRLTGPESSSGRSRRRRTPGITRRACRPTAVAWPPRTTSRGRRTETSGSMSSDAGSRPGSPSLWATTSSPPGRPKDARSSTCPSRDSSFTTRSSDRTLRCSG